MGYNSPSDRRAVSVPAPISRKRGHHIVGEPLLEFFILPDSSHCRSDRGITAVTDGDGRARAINFVVLSGSITSAASTSPLRSRIWYRTTGTSRACAAKIVPVTVLTGSQDARDIERSYHHQANACLGSAVEPGEFMDMIRADTEFWLWTARLPAADGER